MSFKDIYLEMKDKGMLDSEIALELDICRDTLSRWKKRFNIEAPRMKHNRCNVPEHIIKAGVEKGISRRLLLRRIREYGFSYYEAVHTPINKCRTHAGKTKFDKRLEKSERQRLQYQEKKKREWKG
jgi:hypothetical protein